MHYLVLKFVTLNSNYAQSKKGLKNSMGLDTSKIDPPQNQDPSKSLERPYKELLNALFSFEIRHSVLKLWSIKEKPQNSKNSFSSKGF